MCSGEECEWLVVVTGECVWVRMDAYGCIGLGKHKKQTRKDTHGSTAHDFPGIVDGKFPKIHVWVRGDTDRVMAGARWLRVDVGYSNAQLNKANPPKQTKTKQKPNQIVRSGAKNKTKQTTKI